MPRFLLLLSTMLAMVGCTPPGDDDDAGDDDDSTEELRVIPDPGDAAADWGFGINDVCCSTPETAHPVGLVGADPGYIQGVIDENLNFFYVFQADAGLTEFAFPSFFDDVHLHDGAGLRFGAEIEPASVEDFSFVWDVEPDGIYVVEIISADSGFF